MLLSPPHAHSLPHMVMPSSLGLPAFRPTSTRLLGTRPPPSLDPLPLPLPPPTRFPSQQENLGDGDTVYQMLGLQQSTPE